MNKDWRNTLMGGLGKPIIGAINPVKD